MADEHLPQGDIKMDKKISNVSMAFWLGEHPILKEKKRTKNISQNPLSSCQCPTSYFLPQLIGYWLFN